MITEAVLNVFLGFISILLEILPEVDFAIDSDGFSTIANILRMVCYFLPMGTVAAIFRIIVAIGALKIAVSVIKTVWQLLPFA